MLPPNYIRASLRPSFRLPDRSCSVLLLDELRGLDVTRKRRKRELGMEHRDWASSPSSQSSYAPGPPSSTFSSYSDFPGSESFLTLPPIIQGFITNSSNPSGRSSARSHPQTALVEEDSLNPDQLPPFSELTGLREFTDSPLSLGYLPQIQDSISTQNTINLVAESEILPMAPQRASKRAAEAVSLDSPNKRSRRNIAPSIHHDADKSIEEVDLAEDEPALSDTLKKQREQQLALQEDSQKPTKLSKLTCIICLDKMTNITATSCGKFFNLNFLFGRIGTKRTTLDFGA